MDGDITARAFGDKSDYLVQIHHDGVPDVSTHGTVQADRVTEGLWPIAAF